MRLASIIAPASNSLVRREVPIENDDVLAGHEPNLCQVCLSLWNGSELIARLGTEDFARRVGN